MLIVKHALSLSILTVVLSGKYDHCLILQVIRKLLFIRGLTMDGGTKKSNVGISALGLNFVTFFLHNSKLCVLE